MAKMGEGEYYYYLPNNLADNGYDYYGSGMFHIARRDAPHPNFTVIVEQVSQDNASLIVDALNVHQQLKNAMANKVRPLDELDGAP